MAKRPGANKENYEETQRVFLALARLEFAAHGYSRASTNRIVEQSGMARGSLYYHFKDKEDIFRTIFRDMTHDSNNEISRQISPIEDPWNAIIKGADLFLTQCLDPVFRRIVLIESLVAIPYAERMSITTTNYAMTIGSYLQKAKQSGTLSSSAGIKEMSLLIYSIIAEFGRSLEYDMNPEEARHTLVNTFSWALERMKQSPTL